MIGAIKTTKTEAELETTGLVLKLYRERFGVTPVEVGPDLRPLDVSAALSADGRALTLAVVNPTEETRRLRFRLAGGRALSGSGQKWVLTGEGRFAHNRPGALHDPAGRPDVRRQRQRYHASDGTAAGGHLYR